MSVAHLPSTSLARSKRPARWQPEEELQRRIKILWHSRGISGADGLEAIVSGSTVTVRGEVPSQHERWRCLECCRHVPGVRNVVDELIVLEENLVETV